MKRKPGYLIKDACCKWQGMNHCEACMKWGCSDLVYSVLKCFLGIRSIAIPTDLIIPLVAGWSLVILSGFFFFFFLRKRFKCVRQCSWLLGDFVDCNIDRHPDLAFDLGHLGNLISWEFLRMVHSLDLQTNLNMKMQWWPITGPRLLRKFSSLVWVQFSVSCMRWVEPWGVQSEGETHGDVEKRSLETERRYPGCGSRQVKKGAVVFGYGILCPA